MMDLSKLSTEDLKAIQRGDLSAVSTDGLRMIASTAGNPATSPSGVVTAPPMAVPQPKPMSEMSWTEAFKREAANSLPYGMLRGAKDVVDTGAEFLAKGIDKVAGTSLAPDIKRDNEAGKQDFEMQTGGGSFAKVGRLGGNVAATAPVGGVLAAPVRALGSVAPVLSRFTTPLAEALATSGMRAGAAPSASAIASSGRVTAGVTAAGRLATQVAGGAAVGGTSAALVNPEDAKLGAVIGGAFPVATKVGGMALDGLTSLVTPFFEAGQKGIVGRTLNQFASDAPRARQTLAQADPVIPGSMPTTAQAAGDLGLAGLQKAARNANPNLGLDLADRASAQNVARHAELARLAGSVADVEAARASRDAATGALRESALDAAGKLDATQLISRIDSMLKNPNNAGKLAQQALGQVRAQLAGLADQTGKIDARALYAIRKDIGDVLGGKLQGEAGNLRYAASQLIDARDLFDTAIEQSIRRGAGPAPRSASRAVVPGAQPAPGTTVPAPSWRGYLSEYSRLSKPIDQMEALQDIYRRIQSNTQDLAGDAVLSATKLNAILKNEGAELRKVLSTEQLDGLRQVAADLNSVSAVNQATRTAGSDTVQNLASANMLSNALGPILGGSAPATSAVGQLLRLPYGTANTQIQEILSQAMLDPRKAAELMERAAREPAVRAFLQRNGIDQVLARTAAVAPARRDSRPSR
jgi:hypothetical protein